MTEYNPCRYTFEECEPGEYIYRLELLENQITHSDSQSYIKFMEDNGAQHVASYLRWVYFRKKASAGPFEIYTNLETRIMHYQRIIRLWIFLGFAMLFAVLSSIPSVIDFFVNGYRNFGYRITIFFIAGVIFPLGTVLFFRFLPRYLKKVKMLKRERDIRE